jgi:L-lactate dehydrogenase complex protein LldE
MRDLSGAQPRGHYAGIVTRSAPSTVALFVPCYIDQLYPAVAWAALELLEAHGVRVEVPTQQTCCGQPLINTGAGTAARQLGDAFEACFSAYEHVVCPSGSCTATLQRQLARGRAEHAAGRVFELCEFLVDVLGVQRVEASFPHRVALHQSCHALRELGLGVPSELGGGAIGRENPGRLLLAGVRGIELVEPERQDECCGFGGSFCLTEAGISTRMGEDRVLDFERAGTDVVTSLDMSCLMHLSGVSRRQRRRLEFMHIAEVLMGRPMPTGGSLNERTTRGSNPAPEAER